MFYYPNIIARFSQNEPPVYVWVSIEEIKRFNSALFKACRAFNGSGRQGGSIENFNMEETVSWALSARELQFPLPRNKPLWNALSREEWVAADSEDVYRLNLGDTLEQDWISRSADVLELTGT